MDTKFNTLFSEYFGEDIKNKYLLKGGVSDRQVYRLESENHRCIGVFNEKLKENIAFIEFTKSFLKKSFNVPKILNSSKDCRAYIEEDLGDLSLYKLSFDKTLNDAVKIKIYKKCLSDLIKFQINGKDVIDFNFCYETKAFDREQIEFDFEKFNNYYYKNYAGKTKDISEIKETIIQKITKINEIFFMYRDFQPRNILIKENTPYYIDYQSGRLGPLQYDLASFLFSGSININNVQRNELFDYYLFNLSTENKINKNDFINSYYYISLIRLLQILGSYGYLISEKNRRNNEEKIFKAKTNLKSIEEYFEEKEIKEFIQDLTE